MKKLAYFGFVLLLIIGSACSKEKPDNQKIPLQYYHLQEELSISTVPNDTWMIVRPGMVKADAQGNIFILDWKTCQVTTFDAQGRFIRNHGKKGIGPHETLRPTDMAIDSHSNIHLLDSKMRKIVRYHFDGTADHDLKIPGSWPDSLQVTQDGYYLINQLIPNIKGLQKAITVKYNAQGQKMCQSREWIIENIQSETKDIGNGTLVTAATSTPFDPRGYFAFGSNDNLYYGYSDKYQVYQVNPVFKESLCINRNDYERLKVTSKEKEAFIQETKEECERKNLPYIKLKTPELDQVFHGLWSDGDQRLLVFLFTKDQKVYLDAYDLMGRYLEKMIIQLPLTGIDASTVFEAPFFNKNTLYAIVEDEEGQYYIKRYTLVPIPANG